VLPAATAVTHPRREELVELERVRFEMTAYLELLKEVAATKW
jgi:hypothetical protein